MIIRDSANHAILHNFSRNNFPEQQFFQLVAGLEYPLILEIGSRRVIGDMQRQWAGEGARFVGFDILAGENVDVIGDAHQLSDCFKPNTFDAVCSYAVFEHLAMPWQVALEINVILKPGGIAYIASHHTYPVHEIPWDFWRFGADAFETIFSSESGFEVINKSLRHSATLLPVAGKIGNIACGAYYLFADVLCRKIGEADPARLGWRFSSKDVLPTGHFYNSGNYQTDLHAVGGIEALMAEFLCRIKPGGRLLILENTDMRPDHGCPLFRHKLVDWIEFSSPARAHALLPSIDGKYDAIAAIDVFGNVEDPWNMPRLLACNLISGGWLLVKDAQTRAIAAERDLWRFSNEAMRVLFNEKTGFDQSASIMDDEIIIVPDGMADVDDFLVNRGGLTVGCLMKKR